MTLLYGLIAFLSNLICFKMKSCLWPRTGFRQPWVWGSLLKCIFAKLWVAHFPDFLSHVSGWRSRWSRQEPSRTLWDDSWECWLATMLQTSLFHVWGCWNLVWWAHLDSCFKANLEMDTSSKWNHQEKSTHRQNPPGKHLHYITQSTVCRLQRGCWCSDATANVTQRCTTERARQCHQAARNAHDSGTNVEAIAFTLFNASNCSQF